MTTSQPIQPIRDIFTSAAVAVWCTTYNADLSLFAEFLYRRLGDPPLNAVVIMDGGKLNELLQRTDPGDLRYLTANTEWLLRGSHSSSGRFHPKSYLAATRRRATLYIGSGNLTTSGLDSGREVFTAFSTTDPKARPVVGAWLSWLRRIVPKYDLAFAQRYLALEELVRPMLSDPDTSSPFVLVHDLDESIHDQYVQRVNAETDSIAELTVSSPFLDRNGRQIVELVGALQPRRLRLIMTSHIQVHGDRLLSALQQSSAALEVYTYEPDAFTHAKLIAATNGTSSWLLSGSSNASIAGLGLPATTGNTELGLIVQTTPDKVDELLTPPNVQLKPVDVGFLERLTFEPEPETSKRHQITVTNAERTPDSRIRIYATSKLPDVAEASDLIQTSLLMVNGSTGTTEEPLAGQLVVLVDSGGNEVSNRVLVDDPSALDKILNPHEKSNNRSAPPEFEGVAAESLLGRGLLALHRALIMDASEVASTAHGISSEEGETGPDTADELWERLEREHLQIDPRVGNVSRFSRHEGTLTVEGIIELLDAMRDQAPESTPLPNALHPTALTTQDPDTTGTGKSWSLAARVRLRARNVLTRWATAQSDPKLLWVDPMAPLANTSAVITLLVRLWIEYAAYDEPELSQDDLDDIWREWSDGLLGTPGQMGWLERAAKESDTYSDYITDDFKESVTLLNALALRPVATRRTIVQWQPTIQSSRAAGLAQVTDQVANAMAAALNANVNATEVSGILEAAEFYVDDELWGEVIGASLDLSTVRIDRVDPGQDVSVRLSIEGIPNPLNDARVPKLIERARVYKEASGVVIFSLDHDWRLSVTEHDESVYFNRSTGEYVEGQTVAPGQIEAIAQNDAFISDLFTESG